jgi:DNA-binding transcriptional regulator YhcF (GntR family)
MEIHLDRKLPIPIVEQIKGQIKYSIVYGHMKAGELLPSVRELAVHLGVAPLTVARAYRELSEEGLIESRPRSGTFVAEISFPSNSANQLNPSQQNLRQILDNCLRQARLLGHTTAEIRETFLSLINLCEQPSNQRSMVMVGNFKGATDFYAHAIEKIFNGLNVKVIPVVLEDLKTNLGEYAEMIRQARLTITLPTRLTDVRALLEPEYGIVTGVAFQLSGETRRRLSEIQPEARLGVVSTYSEFLQTMLDEVNNYCLLKTPPICAMKDQVRQVKSLLLKIDVLLYASGSEEILEWVPPSVETIEYLHEPVIESVNRLRSFLV